MKLLTYADLSPLYPQISLTQFREDWTGALVDIMNMDIRESDKIFIALKSGAMSSHQLSMFAGYCVREASVMSRKLRMYNVFPDVSDYAKLVDNPLAAWRAMDDTWASYAAIIGTASAKAAWLNVRIKSVDYIVGLVDNGHKASA